MADMAHTAHSPALVHQFETKEQQHEAGSLGMWVFLVTEIMFFGGVFMAYIVYRALHLDAFIQGSHLLDVEFGATNTAVLICSSLTMALAIHAAQTGKSKGTIITYLSSDDAAWGGIPRDQVHVRVDARLDGGVGSRLAFYV